MQRELSRTLQKTKKAINEQGHLSSIHGFGQMVIGILCGLVPILGIVVSVRDETPMSSNLIANVLTLAPTLCLGILNIIGRDLLRSTQSDERLSRIVTGWAQSYIHKLAVHMVSKKNWTGGLFLAAYAAGFVGVAELSDGYTGIVLVILGPVLGVLLYLHVIDFADSIRDVAFSRFICGSCKD
jgi:hypothetical protein